MIKRVIITSVLGLLCGCISVFACKYIMGHDQPLVVNILMVLYNGLMGFTIGISSLSWSWPVHGLVLGGMFGFVLSIGSVALGSEFIWVFIFGLVYGFLIEWITATLFKTEVGEVKS